MGELPQRKDAIEDLRLRIRALETREKKLLQLLHAREALYLKVLDALPINIFLEDREGRTIYANKQTCQMNGMKLDELIGKTVFDLFPPKIAEQQREIDRKVWEQRSLLTKEVKVGFLGSDQYMLTGKNILHLDETDKDYMIGFGLDITDRVKAEQMVSHMAYHDYLTELPNRWFVESWIEQFVNHEDNKQKSMGFILLDLDRFKVINDSLGHQAGDLLLQQVAKRLKGSVNEEKVIARIGGDEFVILVPNMVNKKETFHISETILKTMEEPFDILEQKYKITTSIGISFYPYNGNDLNSLMKSADIAMYRSKENGRNCYSVYSDTMNKLAMDRMDIEVLLRRALDNKEFVLDYQPKIDIKSGRIYGLEALLRWEKDNQIYYPDSFIPIAEETGLIIPIGERVLREACMQCVSWHKKGYPHLSVSVNLSPQQFKKKNLEECIAAIIKETGILPSALELELTESTIMQEPENAVRTLSNLKALGIRISIDDFGTGFSSLSYLKQFPIDILKIDKSFVTNLEWDEANASIAATVITLAHNLKLKVVAEGIETEEQLNFLKRNQCDFGQGYLISRPIKTDHVLDFIKCEYLTV